MSRYISLLLLIGLVYWSCEGTKEEESTIIFLKSLVEVIVILVHPFTKPQVVDISLQDGQILSGMVKMMSG